MTEFLTHIATQILIRHFHLSCDGVFKSVTFLDYFRLYFGFTLSELFCNVWNINATILKDTCYNAILDVGWCRLFLFLNDTSAEHIGFPEMLYLVALCIACFLILFKSEHVCIVHIVAEERNSGVLVEMSVCDHKIIISLVEFGKQRLQPLVSLVLCLIFKNFSKCFLDCAVCLKALNLCVPLNLVSIHFERFSTLKCVCVKFVVFHKQFTQLFALHRFCKSCGIIGCPFTKLLSSERLHELCQHLFLLLILFRIQAFTCRTERVAFLKGKVHFTCHILGVLNEILIVVH